MKDIETITMNQYMPSMGILISLEDKEDFVPIKGSINLKLSNLLDNPKKYLDKTKKYYIYCNKGIRSARAVQILHVYGYNVVKVTK